MKSKICPICHTTFTVKKGDRDICSFECKDKQERLERKKKCLFCGDNFTGRKQSKYCSEYCRISSYNGSKSSYVCRTCNEEKPRAEYIIKIKSCHKCFSKDNPKWVKKKKEETPHFIEIETYLKKIQSKKWRLTYIDMLVLVHLHAHIDYNSLKANPDELFNDLVKWYRDQKRMMFL